MTLHFRGAIFLDMNAGQSSYGPLAQRFDAVDFPGAILGREMVNINVAGPIACGEKDLDQRTRVVDSHRAEFHPGRARHGSKVAPNHALEFIPGEFLLHADGRELVGGLEIRRAQRCKLPVHHRIKIMLRWVVLVVAKLNCHFRAEADYGKRQEETYFDQAVHQSGSGRSRRIDSAQVIERIKSRVVTVRPV